MCEFGNLTVHYLQCSNKMGSVCTVVAEGWFLSSLYSDAQ